jgi:3D (Asp-Asp-Asp) domain-containing protein
MDQNPKKLKIAEKFLILAILALLFEWFLPHIAFAKEQEIEPYAQGPAQFVLMSGTDENTRPAYILPENADKEPKMVRYTTITAYSSTVDQCDSTPFITANGTFVHDGIVAANFLPFGTKIRIPELFGDKVFSVEDRMNSKYHYRVDIWMTTREAAKQLGVKYVKIEVY